MNVSELEQYEQRWLDIKRETSFSYWSSLLNFNGILIAGFTAILVFAQEHTIVIAVLIVSALVSSLLIIENYRQTNKVFSAIGDVLQGKIQQSEGNIQSALQARKGILLRERLALVTVSIEVFLIVYLIFIAINSTSPNTG